MLEVAGLEKSFRTASHHIRAVEDVSFRVDAGCAYTLLGASGCGKTTTLRCIAGLERPSAGMIRLDGREVFNADSGLFVPPDKRGIGMVFQSYAIWPHMNVFENVAFPLRIARRSKTETAEKVAWALEMVKLGDFANRESTQLSGGQQQRLAVARALVQEPKLLLLDEPLSNLDAKLREEMRMELKGLQETLGLTMLYVTHDQTEAIVLSDRIAVMSNGRISQEGSPREIYERPASQFVAGFIGNTSLMDGIVEDKVAENCWRVKTPCGPLIATSASVRTLEEKVQISLRPELIELVAETPSDRNDRTVWEVVVEGSTFLGDSTYYEVSRSDQRFRVRAGPNSNYEPGRSLYAVITASDCVCVPRDGAG